MSNIFKVCLELDYSPSECSLLHTLLAYWVITRRSISRDSLKLVGDLKLKTSRDSQPFGVEFNPYSSKKIQQNIVLVKKICSLEKNN